MKYKYIDFKKKILRTHPKPLIHDSPLRKHQQLLMDII